MLTKRLRDCITELCQAERGGDFISIIVRYDLVYKLFPTNLKLATNLKLYFTGENDEMWDSACPYFAGEQSSQFILRLSRELSCLEAEMEYLLKLARDSIGFQEVENGLKTARNQAIENERRYLESEIG